VPVDDVCMNTDPFIHDMVIVGSGAEAVSAIESAMRSGIRPVVVPRDPSRVDLLHRPLRVWDGDRELRARAIVIADRGNRLAHVFRDWLAHDRFGRLVTAEDSTRTNVPGVFAAGSEAVADALRWMRSARGLEPVQLEAGALLAA
jgi:thioredoxin reductase